MEQSPPDDLVGRIYQGTDTKAAKSPLVVTRDPGGEYVWAENQIPPHVPRRILRRRLLGRAYRFVGRVDAPIIDGQRWAPAPKFDGPGFARWLRRYMEAEGLSVAALSSRAGIHPSLITTLRRGTPNRHVAGKGQKALHPSIESIAGIAHGLNLEFAYVAGKAGFGDDGDRWRNFTSGELNVLSELLDCEIDEIDELLAELAIPRTKETV